MTYSFFLAKKYEFYILLNTISIYFKNELNNKLMFTNGDQFYMDEQ